MSTAAAATGTAPAPKGGKKKLIIMIVVGVLVLAVAGIGAMLMMKKKAHAEDEEGDAPTEHVEHKEKFDPKAVPTFAPLDPFTVNLADHDSERYAQISITLELADAHVADQVKAYMPAIRNNILMVLSHKTAEQLLSREGKEQLAKDIQREACRALGIEPEDEDEEASDDAKPKKKKKKKKAAPALPIKAIQFANFIVQ